MISWAMSHTHPTGVGPSGPPTSAPSNMTDSQLSSTVKTL